MIKPDWANSPEWDGWEYMPDEYMMARLGHKAKYFIEADGWLSVTPNGLRMQGLDLGNPEFALRIANDIVAEFGGWA